MFGGATLTPEDERAALHQALDDALDARGTDPGPALAAALRSGHQVECALAGTKLEVIASLESAMQWAAEGCASPTAWLVGETGLGQKAASGLRRTALDARSMPAVSAAARAGALPMSHLHQLTRARTDEVAELFDRDEEQLVSEAADLTADLTADGLRVRLAMWRHGALEELARNEPDGEPPLPEDEADHLYVSAGFDGRGSVDGDLSPRTAATWRAAIDAEIDGWYRSGALEGDTRSRSELVAAAVTAIIERGAKEGVTRSGPRPLVVGVADLDTLFDRADVPEDERFARRAEIVGGGPVAARTVQALLCDARFSLVITDRNSQPLYVGRAERTATYAQIRAMVARSGGRCEACDCGTPWWRCRAHHLQYWGKDGPTDIDNLAFACHTSHGNIHDRGHTLSRGPTGQLEYRTPTGQLIKQRYTNAA
jgi:hypothetical protein